LDDLGYNDHTGTKATPVVSAVKLTRDVHGEPFDEDWDNISVIGKLSFVEKSTRLDIAYTVHQFGNHKSASDPALVTKAVNKDAWHCFSWCSLAFFNLSFPMFTSARLASSGSRTKKDRLNFDGTFHPDPEAKTINDCANQAPEWGIFGDVFVLHLIRILNLRIEYPDTSLQSLYELLGDTDPNRLDTVNS
jgi:hypothetical protein